MAGAAPRLVRRWVRLGGAVAGCLVAFAWLVPGAFASDSIYWTSYTPNGAIRVGSLDGTGARDLFTAESSPDGIAIDPAADKIYWADTTSGAIRVANLDGSGARDLYTGETQASGVAIDPAAGKIYWSNAVNRTGAIRVGNLDGSGVHSLFSNESYPVGVTVDPAAGKIYWGSYDTFKIRVGNLDGTGARDLFTGENYPTGIVIDPAAGKIYWADEFAGIVRVGNLDGTGATNLFTGEGGVGGLALDPGTGKLYWGDFQNTRIRMGNADGTGTPQTVFSGEPNAWFVALLRAPAGAGAPQVTGAGTPGMPLTCSQGSWAGDVLNMLFYRAPNSFAYQWYVNGAIIPGATATTYTPTAGGMYTCQVTAANRAGATSQTSAPTVETARPSLASSAPVVRGSTAARFSGSVNPEGLLTTAHFEYGLDPRYTGSGKIVYDHSTQVETVGADFSNHLLTVSQSGLVPNALYHVRLVATNNAGTSFGPDVTFTTRKDPAPSAPSLGESFNVSATGRVLIKLHGKFVPLTELRQIPAGTLVNALHGTLKLTTGAPVGGAQHTAVAAKRKPQKSQTKTQSATFGGAVFKITQGRSGSSKGVATVSLVEGAFKGAPTFASCKTHKASAAAVSKKALQLLRASGHGKFRTKGRYAAATVRGTIWTTADRCDGTLIHAIRDSVRVNDLVRHKTVIVLAGHSYLALAKPPKHK